MILRDKDLIIDSIGLRSIETARIRGNFDSLTVRFRRLA